MCRLALGWIPGVEVSEIEADLGGDSLTVRTLEYLTQHHPTGRCAWSSCADVLQETSKWVAFESGPAAGAAAGVLGRAGVERHGEAAAMAGAPLALLPEISSTQIRDFAAEERWSEVSARVPADVVTYLRSAAPVRRVLRSGEHQAGDADAALGRHGRWRAESTRPATPTAGGAAIRERRVHLRGGKGRPRAGRTRRWPSAGYEVTLRQAARQGLPRGEARGLDGHPRGARRSRAHAAGPRRWRRAARSTRVLVYRARRRLARSRGAGGVTPGLARRRADAPDESRSPRPNTPPGLAKGNLRLAGDPVAVSRAKALGKRLGMTPRELPGLDTTGYHAAARARGQRMPRLWPRSARSSW